MCNVSLQVLFEDGRNTDHLLFLRSFSQEFCNQCSRWLHLLYIAHLQPSGCGFDGLEQKLS